MDNILKRTFIHLGLTEKEIRFLEALYSLGPSTMQQITKKSRLQRSTAYLIMQHLEQLGFLQEDFKAYRKEITAIEPHSLLRMLKTKQRLIRRQEMELEENLPQIETFYKTSSHHPHIQYFEGSRALFAIWEDVLKTKGEILLWTNQATENLFFTSALHTQFIKQRIINGIPIRALAVNNNPGKDLVEKDNKSLRHSKLLPIQTTFRAETYIYDSKIAILDHEHDITGLIIASESISSTQRAIFEMTWNQI